jgi:hypothetical protein
LKLLNQIIHKESDNIQSIKIWLMVLDILILLIVKITSTNFPLFCMITFSASLTHLVVLLPHLHDCNYYVSRKILAPPPLLLQKNSDIGAKRLRKLFRLKTAA